MPRLTDSGEIGRLLRRDPGWSVYALGDLAPAMFPKATWFTPDLTLVLRDYGTAILFAMGTGSVREALDTIDGPVHLQVQQDALDEIRRHAHVSSATLMLRMVWTGQRSPARTDVATRLGAPDVEALQRLYADGEASGESPDFFFPSMVTDGVFHGVRDGGELNAAAGTHLVSRDEGIACIGNVYTRRDSRGRGLARQVVSAVVADLTGIETIGLNVRADNPAAIHLYESLGFVRHCEFFEALREPSAP